MPVVVLSPESNSVTASNPPAEAPIPTTGNDGSACSIRLLSKRLLSEVGIPAGAKGHLENVP